MKRIVKCVGLAIGVAATIAFIVYAANVLGQHDLGIFANWNAGTAIATCTVAYLSIVPLSALAWKQLLRGMAVEQGWRELAEIMAVAQLAKYLPGNVGVHVARVAMSVSRGLPTMATASSMLAELALTLLAAFMVAAGSALAWEPHVRLPAGMIDQIALAGLITAVASLAVFALSPRFEPLIRRVADRRGWRVPGRALPDIASTLRALGLYLANYVLIGIGIWAMARQLLPGETHDLALLTSSFALSWMAGFIAPGAPAGLGVREGVLLLLLQMSYDPKDAVVLVIAIRLTSMVGDAVCFVVGYGFFQASRHTRRSGHAGRGEA